MRLIRRRGRDPADAILREATLGYDLVVLGAPERTGEREVFSTVIDRVLARLELPTLIFRYPNLKPEGGLSDAAIPEVRRVLLSVESNPASPRRRGGGLLFGGSQRWDGLCLASDHRDRRWPLFLRHEEQRRNFMAGRELVEESVAYGQRLGARVHTDVRPVANRRETHHHRQLGKLGPVGGGRRQSAPHQPTLLRLRDVLHTQTCHDSLVIVAVPDSAYRSTTR